MNELADVISNAIKGKAQTGSDYTAKVTRVEGSTAYVQITGSDIADTPVAMSVSAKAGDMVRVRVANGRAWITGNDTLPPSNDHADVMARMLRDMSDRADTIVIDFGKMKFLGNTLVVDSKNFKLDEFGNAKFSGKLEAAEGDFKGTITINGNYDSGPNQSVIIAPTGYAPLAMYYQPSGEMFNATARMGATQISLGQDDMRGSSTKEPKGVFTATNIKFNDTFAGNLYTELTKDSLRVQRYTAYTTYDSTGAHPSSDRRLKEDITEIDPETAKRMIPVRFRFKGEDKLHYGFIAQDVQKVIPDVVSEDDDGYLSLTYHELIAPLYALVQEQERRITQLEARLKALKEVDHE